MRSLFAFVVLLCVSGCTAKPKDEMISSDKVPEAALSAAQQLCPGFVADQVWKVDLNGETVYEFRGKSGDGKAHETTISSSGDVLWPAKKGPTP